MFAQVFNEDFEPNNMIRSQMRSYDDTDQYDVGFPLLLANNTLSYDVLRSCPHGRQLMLITLLEDFGSDCWMPRCHGYLKMYLPDSLKAAHQPAPGRDACMLKDIWNRGRMWTRNDIVNIFYSSAASRIKPNDRYSRFRRTDVEAVNSLVKLALSQENFDSLMSLLLVVKDYCNHHVMTEAVIKIILARRDTGFVIPSLRAIAPADFFPDFSGNMGRTSQLQNGVRSFSFRTTHRTLPPEDPESELWHYREDSKVNTMHGVWHILISDPNAEFIMRRRGELFAFMHKQLVNRYNVERLGVGLDVVEAYRYEDWITPSLQGYDPGLGPELAPGVLFYSPRLDGQRMTDEQALIFRNYAAFMERGIAAMSLNNSRLGYSNGVDFGISPLGDVVEPFPELEPVNASLFHNRGHVVISEMSEAVGDRAGVMGFVETAMRDPAFYRWHKYTDEFFDFYKIRLGSYTTELEFPGVVINDVSIYSGARKNTIRTFVEYVTLQLDENLLRSMNGTRLQYERVNHDNNIEYRLSIDSTVTEGGIVRLFLIPEEMIDRPDMTSTVVEMDRFYVELTPGPVNIRRRLEDSAFFSPGAPSLTTLQEQMMRGMTELEFNYANCGWPLELAFPKGNRQGQKFQLVAFISRLLPGDRDSIEEWREIEEISWGWCGIRAGDGSMPDNRPMGFPFDRPTTLNEIMNRNRGNMKTTRVNIFHVGS